MSERLIPNNSVPHERALANMAGEMLDMPVPIRDLWSPDRCPAAALPHLAWALSVDFWDPAWPETRKRASIRESIRIHRTKGSPGSIKRVLRALGMGDAVITEGIDAIRYDGSADYDGSERYGEPAHWATYRVYLSRPITNAQAAMVREVLSLTAPARCRLAGLDYVEANNIYDGEIDYDGAFNYGVA